MQVQIIMIIVYLVILVSALRNFRRQHRSWSWPEFIAGFASIMLIYALLSFALSRDKDMTIVSWWTIVSAAALGIALASIHQLYLNRRNQRDSDHY